MTRDLLFEKEWLDRLGLEIERRYGHHPAIFTRSILERLSIGAERYGDDDFAGKDVIMEALEETPDVAAYALLETHKRNGEDRHGQHHLFEAAVCAALADWHLRRARDDDA